MAWPIDDKTVLHAVSGIPDHSERQPDLNQLKATFVDPGIVMHLNNNKNQIVFGRRGTGKTHLFKVLQHRSLRSDSELPVYIDMRTLGSHALWAQSDRPAFVRVVNLLKDVLGPIHTALLDHATRPTAETPGPALESVSAFGEAMSSSILADETISTEQSVSVGKRFSADAAVDLSLSPKLTLRGGDEETHARALRIVQEGRPLERLLFGQIGSALHHALADAGVTRLLILLDEWNAIPAELQPMLAEFLKRTFFPHPAVAVKIAAIDYRCIFGVPLARDNTLGFEMTGDISASLDLDEFFVFDRDEQVALNLFSEVLFRHLAAECDRYWLGGAAEWDHSGTLVSREAVRDFAARNHGRPGYYIDRRFGIKNAQDFVGAFFDDQRTFTELARAGEGVIRDFMRLFHDTCFDTVRRSKRRVDIRSVRQVARELYAKEKRQNADVAQAEVLKRIVGEVVGRHKARSFLFEQGVEQTEMIRSLMDLRLIHLVKRGFTPEDDPTGQPYDVYTLDYGTYVHALGTDRAPTGDFSQEHGPGADVVVPFHDDRAIRRVILDPDLLMIESAGTS
jgi:hypothetical protein